MDVKASARAKHASSQQGRARHSTRKQQPQQQQQHQKVANDSQQAPQNKKDLQLPSNWDRYEEEDEEGQDERLSDVLRVKSKGANYRDLLAEKSALQGSDLSLGRKRMMITRGLDLWSRISEIDNLWSAHKVSGDEDNFLTLDLDFLSEALAKVDIAERLMVDPKYIPLEERVKYSSVHKGQEVKPAEDAGTSSIPANRTITEDLGVTTDPGSVSPQERNFFQSNKWAQTKESAEGAVNVRFFEKDGASPKVAPKKELEVPENDRSVSKKLLTQLPNNTSSFDAESAEAELDTLLDMLDKKSTRQAQSSVSNRSFQIGKTAGQGSEHDALHEEKNPPDVYVQTSHESTSNANVGTSNNIALPSNDHTKVAGAAGYVPLNAQVVDSMKSVPKLNLDEDFDNWLDSL